MRQIPEWEEEIGKTRSRDYISILKGDHVFEFVFTEMFGGFLPIFVTVY